MAERLSYKLYSNVLYTYNMLAYFHNNLTTVVGLPYNYSSIKSQIIKRPSNITLFIYIF